MPRTAALKDPITGAPLSTPKATGKEDKAPVVRKAKLAAVDPINMSAAERKAANAEASAKAVKKAFAPPKNLAQCADMFYSKREERLALERQAAIIQAEENACREQLINNLPKSEASGIAGKLCRVAVENKAVATVKDWSVESGVWGYIIKNIKKTPGVTGMLQRRVNEAMIKELKENGVNVPGVEFMDVPVLRVNKL
jgi:hypothetical protein